MRHFLSPRFPEVRSFRLWVGCPFCEEDFRSDPRAFAHTMCQPQIVCCSPRLLAEPLAVQAGILAHELGHLIAFSRWQDTSEEAADGVLTSHMGWKIDYPPPLFLQTLEGGALTRLQRALP